MLKWVQSSVAGSDFWSLEKDGQNVGSVSLIVVNGGDTYFGGYYEPTGAYHHLGRFGSLEIAKDRVEKAVKKN